MDLLKYFFFHYIAINSSNAANFSPLFFTMLLLFTDICGHLFLHGSIRNSRVSIFFSSHYVVDYSLGQLLAPWQMASYPNQNARGVCSQHNTHVQGLKRANLYDFTKNGALWPNVSIWSHLSKGQCSRSLVKIHLCKPTPCCHVRFVEKLLSPGNPSILVQSFSIVLVYCTFRIFNI